MDNKTEITIAPKDKKKRGWNKTTLWLTNSTILGEFILGEKASILHQYGQMGVDALAAATPKDTGKTAGSWYYDIGIDTNGLKITWRNSNENKGVNIAIILQYGHGTRNGGYVKGIDYINPALKSVFSDLADAIWTEVNE
nr:MAG TPA: type I neck protein [Caudoviricetes sp.]